MSPQNLLLPEDRYPVLSEFLYVMDFPFQHSSLLPGSQVQEVLSPLPLPNQQSHPLSPAVSLLLEFQPLRFPVLLQLPEAPLLLQHLFPQIRSLHPEVLLH